MSETNKKSGKGYPTYPSRDDIYSREKEESSIDPEDLNQKKAQNPPAESWNEKDFSDDMTGEDLDVPGSDEAIPEIPGTEDEENEYFSLGGDDHEDLDEDAQ